MNFEKNLKGEYLVKYKEVVSELRSEDLSCSFVADVENDILEMFLSAQEDGVEVQSLLGVNTRDFVQTIVSGFNEGENKRFRLWQMITKLIYYVGIISIFYVRNGRLEFTIDILICAVFILGADIVGRAISKKYSLSKNRRIIKNIVVYGLILVLSILTGAISRLVGVKPLFVVMSPYVMSITCIVVGTLILAKLDKKFN